MFTRFPVVTGTAAVVLTLGLSGPAAADAHEHASCVGFEASGIAPAGSSDEFPGGPAELQAFLRDAVGHPTGPVITEAAQQHLGSHEACDAGE